MEVSIQRQIKLIEHEMFKAQWLYDWHIGLMISMSEGSLLSSTEKLARGETEEFYCELLNSAIHHDKSATKILKEINKWAAVLESIETEAWDNLECAQDLLRSALLNA